MKLFFNLSHVSIFTVLEEAGWFSRGRAIIAWRAKIEAEIAPLTLTHPQFVILIVIGWLTREGMPITQVEVGRVAGFDPNTTSQIIRGLEGRLLLKRLQSTDARSKNPMLTQHGLELLYKAVPLVEKADNDFFEILTQEDKEVLKKIVYKLISNYVKKH